MANGVRTVSISIMYASFRSDAYIVVDISGEVGAIGSRPPDESVIPIEPNIKCAFGWAATATPEPETEITPRGALLILAGLGLVSMVCFLKARRPVTVR